MAQKDVDYVRKTRNLCTHLDAIIYRIFSENHGAELSIEDIQDKIEEKWDIRPYRATILRHALNFYQEHLIPLICKTGFSMETYRLNTQLHLQEWEEFFKPKPRGRPKKYTQGEQELDSQL